MPSASSSAPALKLVEISKGGEEEDTETVKNDDEDQDAAKNDGESQTNNEQSNGSNETMVDASDLEKNKGGGPCACCMTNAPCCNYRRLAKLTICVKIIEIVLGFVILALAGIVVMDRMETVGSGHAKGMGTFSTFIVCVFSSLMFSLALLAFQVVVDRKTKHRKKVGYWMKGLDLISAMLLIVGFILEFYILIKWQVDWNNSFGQDLPQLGEMITISIFTAVDVALYFLVLCTSFQKYHCEQDNKE